MGVTKGKFHEKIHDFEKILSSTEVKHKNWENKKKDTIISILNSKLDDIEEILQDHHFKFEIKENDDISIEMEFGYLQVELKYKHLFNGKIEVKLIYPEIKNEDGKPKKLNISSFKSPDLINEPTINNDLYRSFKYMSSEF